MKLEDQVCNLELSKRLKELGVKQESLYKWIQKGGSPDDWDESFLELSSSAEKRSFYVADGYCSAFTVAELGEILIDQRLPKPSFGEIDWLWELDPKTFDYNPWDGWKNYADKYIGFIFSKTEADARAKMLIYLLEKGLVKV